MAWIKSVLVQVVLSYILQPQARLHTLWPTPARPRRMAAVQTEKHLPQDLTKRDVPVRTSSAGMRV